jgi:hypothetical protein
VNLLAHIRNLREASEHADPLAHRSFTKPAMFRSPKWLKAVADLGVCVVCDTPGGTQAAHRNEGKGMGLKTHDCWTASICPSCHADIDSGKDLDLSERRRVMDLAILDTFVLLVQQGKVVVK